MEKSLTLYLLVFILIGTHSNLPAQQSNTWVKQVITANSGRFEYVPPTTDYVTLQSFNPAQPVVNVFGTIFTQSSQDILISGGFAYVNAQDSIIKYNLNDYSRMAAIADSGLSKLALFQNRLIVSKQYPLTSNFVDVLDTADLSLVARVEGISGDCGGIACTADTVYVAVNGGWMGSVGKIAVIDPGTWTLDREIDLGAEAIGINNLFHNKNKIYSVNKTPYGIPNVGSISVYDPATGSFSNRVIGVKVGNATGIKDSILYAIFNEGIGAFNLNTMNIADTVVVPDPGSALFTYILSSCIDTINNTLHVNVGDYVTPGYCRVASIAGDSLDTYSTGISTDAVAVDYRKYPLSIGEPGNHAIESLSLFPNPVSDILTMNFKDATAIETITITDINSRTVMSLDGTTVQTGSVKIKVDHLKSGIYAVVVKGHNRILTGKFIRRD